MMSDDERARAFVRSRPKTKTKKKVLIYVSKTLSPSSTEKHCSNIFIIGTLFFFFFWFSQKVKKKKKVKKSILNPSSSSRSAEPVGLNIYISWSPTVFRTYGGEFAKAIPLFLIHLVPYPQSKRKTEWSNKGDGTFHEALLLIMRRWGREREEDGEVGCCYKEAEAGGVDREGHKGQMRLEGGKKKKKKKKEFLIICRVLWTRYWLLRAMLWQRDGYR